MKDNGVKQSFSSPGTPYDNAVAESMNSIMKREEISHHWYHTIGELRDAVTEFVSYYNGYRTIKKLGDITPDEYERRYSESIENTEKID